MTPEETAWKIAPILDSLGVPQIRVAPTSNMLLHHPKYSNLISAVPSEKTVHLALVQMLARLNWNYIQVGKSASLWLFDCLVVCLSICVFETVSVSLSVCLPICTCLPFCPPLSLSPCLTDRLSVW